MSRPRLKSVVVAPESATGLRRVLGAGSLVSLGIGAIIGTGIFVLTGQAAAMHAGPAIVVSMVIAGVVSALAGLCYAEFAAAVPASGSAYTYAYATLGETVAWIIGWDLVLEYALGAATVAVGWSSYAASLAIDLGLSLPAALSAPPGTMVPGPGGESVAAILNLPAMLVAVLVTLLLVRGVRESATVNTVMVVIKVAVVLLVIATGIWFVRGENFTPLVPPNSGAFGEYGWSGVLRGAAVIFFAYIGFDAVSTAAQEARDPARDLPRGILGSLAVCTVLYVVVAGVMVGLVPFGELGGAAPMAAAVDAARLAAAGTPVAPILSVMPILVKVAIIAGLTSTMVVQMLAQPRIFMAMSQDGLLPGWVGRVHPRLRTPHLSTLATGLVVATAAGFTPIDVLGQLVSIGTLMAFVIVSIGILILRRTQPDLPRPFRTPWVPWIPLASAALALGLMLTLPLGTWQRLIIWMAIGFAIYLGYGRRHSRLA
jgi:APA family basic amino acid/polyamine antiporter